jgi:drug/metabolite transporter (DMT)-like permease
LDSSAIHQPTPATNELSPAASLFAVFLCMLFGANPVAVKISLTGIGIFTSAGLRFSIAAVVLLTWARLTKKPIAISRKQVIQMACLALIFFFQISIFYYGQNKTTASHGALIGNILPFIVMVMAHYLLPNDKITFRKISGLLLGFCGIILLFIDSVSLTADALQGDFILVVAVVIWGCNVIYVKRITSGFHPFQITVYPMIMAIPLYYFAGYFLDGQMIRDLNPSVMKGMFYQSFVTASFGFVMWNTLIQKYGATTLHSFIFLMPISGVLLGVLILNEPITTNLLASIALVSAGLVVINWQRKKIPVANITV